MHEQIKDTTITMLCEYMTRPEGLDMPRPRFFWSISDNTMTVSAYRIVVTDKAAGRTLWNSRRTEQENAHCAVYDGEALSSGMTCHWELVLYLKKDGQETELSGESSFTMGLLEPDAWTAGWIGGIKLGQHSTLYRTEWTNKKPVRRAAAFVASPCYYVLTVNGRRADDTVLNNVFADPEKSLYYRTYDITELISDKENAVGIMTGHGWHSLRVAEDGVGWGDSLFSAQIRLEYEDGSAEWLESNTDNWTYTTEGPVRFNSIYNGEVYDAGMELPGWDSFGFDDSAFSAVVEREAPAGQYRSQMLEPIRAVREFAPAEIIDVGDGSYTLDFGVNFAGWVRLKMRGEKGQEVSMKPAELRYADGRVNTLSLRKAQPVDTYIFKGEGVEEYEPRFTYHGFRYVQVFGLAEKPEPGMFIGCMVRTAAEKIGDFACDNEIVNAFYAMVCQTEESNLHGVPTDCPQRDERLGWLNDMTVRNECALNNYNLYQLYAKWLRDIRDTQGRVTGAVTDTAPFLRYGFRPADPVSAAFLQLPWNLYLQYGDDSVIRENYDANARWVEYLRRNSTGLIVNYSSMGDWAAPIGGTDHTSSGGGAISAITPQLLMSTGYFYHDCTLMEKMARVLGKAEDEAYYRNLAAQIKEAFNRTYYNFEKKYYAANSQASNVLPLYFGMVEETEREAVLESLCHDIMVTHGGHLTTGNLCTRYAIEVLFRYGKEDIAWHLLTQTEYPGWGYMLKNGATTLWERWEKVETESVLSEMASMNHPMNGGAAVSLHKHLAGIRVDEEHPGYARIGFCPRTPKQAGAVRASIKTVRGTVSSAWRREQDGIVFEFSVPSGCTATATLPGSGESIALGAGDHVYHIKNI